jgi:ribosomal protein S15P/S13E
MALTDFYKRQDIRALLHKCERLRHHIQAAEEPDEEDLEEFLAAQGTILALRAEVDSRPVYMRYLKGEKRSTPAWKIRQAAARRAKGCVAPKDYLAIRRQRALLKRGWKSEELVAQDVHTVWEAEKGKELTLRAEKPKRFTMGRKPDVISEAAAAAIAAWVPQPLRWD